MDFRRHIGPRSLIHTLILIVCVCVCESAQYETISLDENKMFELKYLYHIWKSFKWSITEMIHRLFSHQKICP